MSHQQVFILTVLISTQNAKETTLYIFAAKTKICFQNIPYSFIALKGSCIL